MLAAQSRVNAWNLRTGNLSAENEFSKIRDSLDKLSRAPIFVDDMAGNSIVRMRSVCRRIKAEHGIGMIIVDYLQLMSTAKNYDSMVNQVTEISRSLKGLAKEFNVPVIALSQLSRAVESRGGRPRLSDLRDSGSIEQDADVVMFIHREDKGKDESERTNIAEILIEKHRNGPVGKVELYFDEKLTTFMSIEKSNINNFSSSAREVGDIDQF
jgi:replicative DNA helicase